jgi:hypothetical protein
MRNTCPLFLVLMCLFTNLAGQQPPSEKEDLTGPIQTFQPSQQRAISYSDQSLQVSLIVGTDRHSLRIRNRATKAQKTVALPRELAQVDEIRAGPNGKLVVRGMVNGSVSEIVVVDSASTGVVDVFWCYLPTISPLGEYIAFMKFYPAHFVEGSDDHYMLYDLDKNPIENRPPGVAPDDPQDVGRAFYPPGVGNKPGDNVGVPEESQHQSASRIFWIPDGRQLFFANRVVGSEGEIDLILADIGERGDVTLKIAKQDPEPLCSTLKDPERVRSCLLLVRKVEFHPGPRPSLTATFEVVELRKLVALDFDFSRFLPTN